MRRLVGFTRRVAGRLVAARRACSTPTARCPLSARDGSASALAGSGAAVHACRRPARACHGSSAFTGEDSKRERFQEGKDFQEEEGFQEEGIEAQERGA